MGRLASLFAASLLVLLGACTSVPPTPEGGGMISAPTDDERRARIRLELAVGYYGQGQLAVALDELRQALQADPKLADAYSMRGLIFMEMGEDALAEESLRHALRLVPNSPDYNNNFGWFLCQTGRERESIAFFEKAWANKRYQSPAKAYSNAGVCLLRLKQTEAAERHLLQAFQLDAANPVTSQNLAQLYYERADYDRARFYIGRVLAFGPASAEALWLALRIERKLGDRASEAGLAAQLRRRFPASPEYAAYQRGALDD